METANKIILEPVIIQHLRTLLPRQLFAFCRDEKINSKNKATDPEEIRNENILPPEN